MHNPVVDDDLAERARAPLDDPWFRTDAPPVVMSIGRLSPEKDFATLLWAFARLRSTGPHHLLILGEGRERRRLEALAEELGIAADVRMPGFVADPYPYLARASVYVLSSEREGLPSALIQAMACSCPVVSTDCPSGPAEVLLAGELGELVPIGDAETMAAAIGRAIRDPKDVDLAKQRSMMFSTARSLHSYTALMDSMPVRR
ncbi:hypothetical protein BH23DEI1_BH23DEI1_23280 [soil metagenome]